MAGALRVSARVPAEADGGGEVSTPLRELSAIFSIDLHPSRTLDLHAAVRDELNARLMRYDERLDGVMLAYWKEKLATESARLLNICPFVNVRVKARVLLFTPSVGARLVGRVNMVGADHVGVLVFNMFNVSIGRENIRKDLRFVDTAFGGEDRARVESSAHAAHVISSGTDVAFTVVGINESEDVLSLTGALQAQDTGSVAFLSQHRGAAAAEGEEERRRRKRERRAARAAAEAAGAPQEAPAAGWGGGKRRRQEEREDAAPEGAVASPGDQLQSAAQLEQRAKKQRKKERQQGHS